MYTGRPAPSAVLLLAQNTGGCRKADTFKKKSEYIDILIFLDRYYFGLFLLHTRTCVKFLVGHFSKLCV
jgi:hypothetical protein